MAYRHKVGNSRFCSFHSLVTGGGGASRQSGAIAHAQAAVRAGERRSHCRVSHERLCVLPAARIPQGMLLPIHRANRELSSKMFYRTVSVLASHRREHVAGLDKRRSERAARCSSARRALPSSQCYSSPSEYVLWLAFFSNFVSRHIERASSSNRVTPQYVRQSAQQVGQRRRRPARSMCRRQRQNCLVVVAHKRWCVMYCMWVFHFMNYRSLHHDQSIRPCVRGVWYQDGAR